MIRVSMEYCAACGESVNVKFDRSDYWIEFVRCVQCYRTLDVIYYDDEELEDEQSRTI